MVRELDAFLDDTTWLRFIDLLLPDLHGVDRGKRVDIASARSIFANGLLLPGSHVCDGRGRQYGRGNRPWL